MAASAELAIMFTAKGDLQAKLTALNSEMKELRKATDAAVKAGDSAEVQRLSEAYAKTGAEITRTRNALKATNAEIKRVATEGTASTTRLQRAWAGLKRVMASPLIPAITITSMVYFGKRAVEAFAEAEQGQLKLQLAMQKFPALSDVSAQSFAALNTELMNTTGADDDLLAASEGILARFRLTGTQIQQLIPLVNDYAIATGRTVPDAATAIGKALMGNARAMKELGIDFKVTGDRAADFTVLMGALERKVGGTGEAFGKTTSGQLAIAQSNFENLQEEIGAGLVPALEALVSIVRPIAEWFAGLSDGAKKVAVALGVLGGAALALGPRLLMLRTEMALLKTQAAGAGTATAATGATFLGMGKGGWKAAAGITALVTAMTAVAATDSVWINFGSNLDDIENDAQRTANAMYGIISPGAYKSGLNVLEGIMAAFLPVRPMLQAEKESVAEFDAQLVALVTDGNMAKAEALFNQQADAAAKYGASVDEVMGLLPGYAAALEATGAATDGVDYSVRRTAINTYTLAAAARAAAGANQTWADSLERVNGLLSAEAALQSYKQSLKAYVEEPTKATALSMLQSLMSASEGITDTDKRARFLAKGLTQVEDVASSSGMKLSPGLQRSVDAAWRTVAKLKGDLYDVDAIDPFVDITIRVGGDTRIFGGGDLYSDWWRNDARGGPVRRKAAGGYIQGPGTDTSDTAGLFALSAGEYVVRAKAARALGLATMNRINQADKMVDPTLLGRVELRERRDERVAGPLIGSITVNNPGSDVDVERAVSSALARAERRRRERS